ncbi:Uncharacterised protein [Mycobacteroides abscessus subsp. abscessus]|nr:Uncharacterised protein [Mycobacteroides abscessus subsp. abscessus]
MAGLAAASSRSDAVLEHHLQFGGGQQAFEAFLVGQIRTTEIGTAGGADGAPVLGFDHREQRNAGRLAAV